MGKWEVTKYSLFALAFAYHYGILDFVVNKYNDYNIDFYCRKNNKNLSSLECGIKFTHVGNKIVYGVGLEGLRIGKQFQPFSNVFKLDDL